MAGDSTMTGVLDNLKIDLLKVQEQLQVAQEQLVFTQSQLSHGSAVDPLLFMLTVFVLACFVGYYVVWRVTPALHTPLMSVTNAISGIVVVGAIIAVGAPDGDITSRVLGFMGVVLASVNIFGGFVVTHRMLDMYKKKEVKK